MLKPADVLIDEVNFESVRTRESRRRIVDPDVYGFARSDGGGQPWLTVKLTDNCACTIKDSYRRHHDAGANGPTGKPERIPRVLNREWYGHRLAGSDPSGWG